MLVKFAYGSDLGKRFLQFNYVKGRFATRYTINAKLEGIFGNSNSGNRVQKTLQSNAQVAKKLFNGSLNVKEV
jgi:hypothetical protein